MGGWNFFVPDFHKLPYSLRSQGDKFLVFIEVWGAFDPEAYDITMCHCAFHAKIMAQKFFQLKFCPLDYKCLGEDLACFKEDQMRNNLD